MVFKYRPQLLGLIKKTYISISSSGAIIYILSRKPAVGENSEIIILHLICQEVLRTLVGIGYRIESGDAPLQRSCPRIYHLEAPLILLS